MTIRIVANKKIDMSDDEYALYKNISQSYDDEGYSSDNLFSDLFETDDDGIIIFLRPPRKKATTIEIFLFLTGLMTQQHLRMNYLQIEDLANQIKNKLKEFDDRLAKLESK